MIAGITGHQDLGPPDAVQWIRAAVDSLIVRENITSGFTSLAAGADQLFASLMRARALPYVVVVPCASYESAFPSEAARAAYGDLLRASVRLVELPYAAPTQQAFYEAGKCVVSQSDLVFAVWNGLPAKGLGGTADVVRFALATGRKTIQVNPLVRKVALL